MGSSWKQEVEKLKKSTSRLDLLSLQRTHMKQKRRSNKSRHMALAGQKCKLCGCADEKILQRHHTDYARNRVIVVCDACHKKIHRVIDNETKRKTSAD
jgi:hypothetical protein